MSISVQYDLVWIKDQLDLQELANKRWIERWSMAKLVQHFGYGRTAIVRKLGQLKKSPDLIEDGVARSLAKSRKYRFMGGV